VRLVKLYKHAQIQLEKERQRKIMEDLFLQKSKKMTKKRDSSTASIRTLNANLIESKSAAQYAL
jgi:hypothetical protein